ncbi:MAG: sensor histidine kinase [Flavitalea sp.]
MQVVLDNMQVFHRKIKSIGYLDTMDDYEKRKLGIFNLLNVLGFLIGIFLPIVGLSITDIQLPASAWLVTFSPAMISILVLVFNYYQMHENATLCYFVMYPVLTALVYEVSFDVGIELFFILYGVLSVFFLKRFIHIVFAFSLTLFFYFYVFVFTKDYQFQLADSNFPFYVLNHLLPAGFIFYALFQVKQENTLYQLNILENYRELHRVNALIDEKARLLEIQTTELSELNTLKNKLFSVISHDLKSPLYALRNLFRGFQQYNLPAEEIKQYIPEVVKDLNYTTALMENLLIWVKSQMNINVMHPQILEVSELVKEATDLLRLHAHTKQIAVRFQHESPAYIFADRDMISLVIRNLLSNAIKFTPQRGNITIWLTEKDNQVEIFVKDTGIGMEPLVVKQLFENNYYSTKGTADETGTGLGLMLCKDFLSKNGGKLTVTSKPGEGSTFSFTLPRKIVSNKLALP